MKASAAARSRARTFLLQALYQAQLTGSAFGDVAAPFMADHDMKRADTVFFQEALRGIEADEPALRALIEEHGERSCAELDPIEKGILYLGAFELKSRAEIPYRVVINEAIELAKSFGAAGSYRYVNSVLDGMAKGLRPGSDGHDGQ